MSTSQVVQNMQNAAMDFADTMSNNMVKMANNAINQNYPGINDPSGLFSTLSLGGVYAGFSVPDAPVLPPISAETPTAPALGPVSVPVLGDAPTFTMAMPVVTLPTAPDATLPVAPGGAPAFNAPVLPDAPVLSLPQAPTISQFAIPDVPAISMPTFTSELPVNDIVAPSEVFSYAEEMYDSALLDALKKKLMYDLVNGGYGIEPADEQGLWERLREREQRNTNAAMMEAARQFAMRGLPLPPGALNATLQRAQQDMMEKASSASRDIGLKRADLYVENRRFTIEQVRETEQMLMAYTGSLMERALNAARATVELGIAVFNAKVAKFNLGLEVYRTSAQVYETLIRGAMLQLEAYRTQVEGIRVAADVQRIYAEVYRIQLDGVNTLVNLYTAKLNAANIVVGIERSKLDAFRAQVDAYAAQVGAKTAEFEMYATEIGGEEAKVRVFQSAAGAYASEVSAYAAKAHANEVVVQSQVAANNSLLERYRADITRYTADLEAAKVAIDAVLTKYSAQVQASTALNNATIALSSERVMVAKAQADIAMSQTKMVADYTISKANILTTQARTAAEINQGLASAFGAVAQGALSGAVGLVEASGSG